MNILEYDGSLDGFYCALERALDEGGDCEIRSACRPGDTGLFGSVETVPTDLQRAVRFHSTLETIGGGEMVHQIFYAYLSDVEEIENEVLRWVRVVKANGRASVNDFSIPETARLRRICRKVGGEAHRMLGLMRFRLLSDGVFYGPMEPDHNILPIIIPHFMGRFRGQKWMIHDLRRGIGALFDGKSVRTLSIENGDVLFEKLEQDRLDGSETGFQELWQAYYKTIAIAERKNPKCQSNFMPRRYWKYLVERPSQDGEVPERPGRP